MTTPEEQDHMHNPFKIDWTINLSSLVGALIIIGSGFAWVSRVEMKLNNVAELVTQSQRTAMDISDLQKRVAVMDERSLATKASIDRMEGRLATMPGGVVR